MAQGIVGESQPQSPKRILHVTQHAEEVRTRALDAREAVSAYVELVVGPEAEGERKESIATGAGLYADIDQHLEVAARCCEQIIEALRRL